VRALNNVLRSVLAGVQKVGQIGFMLKTFIILLKCFIYFYFFLIFLVGVLNNVLRSTSTSIKQKEPFHITFRKNISYEKNFIMH